MLSGLDPLKVSNLDKANENAQSLAKEILRLLPVRVVRSVPHVPSILRRKVA
jgi:chromosome partitioning protein